MESAKHDLVVIGAGPGGYVAALRAAQLGVNVACIDENEVPGGTCLRVGCIPSKALLESSQRYYEARHTLAAHGVAVADVQLDLPTMQKRKESVVRTLCRGVEGLLKRQNITYYRGRARFDGPGRLIVDGRAEQTALASQYYLIATGSTPATMPGVGLDGQGVGSSTDALAYTEVPRHLVVIGAGYIGLELGSVWSRLGSRVTVIEMLDRLLPGMDGELAGEARRLLERQGLTFWLSTRVNGAYSYEGRCLVECEGRDPLECDRVLLAVGRRPNTDGLGLETIGVRTDQAGFITVDKHFATAAGNVFAIGDCIGGPMLAHKASEEGIACVERLVTGYGRVDYATIPSVVYTHPEIASVGKTEEQLQADDHPYRKGTFPLRANGRARALGEVEGLVKILADQRTDRILGVHILGARAGDMIAEAVAAMECGASAEDLARTCHAHPTLAEAIQEAALAVDGRPLHL